MPSREARDKTICAINLIHLALLKKDYALILSTYNEKAFDRVDPPHFGDHCTCPHMGSWINALYLSPSAQVHVNGECSSLFPIKNATRQGCPLSPFIFIFTLMAFFRTIRANPNIADINFRNRTHNIAAYADDSLFSSATLLPHYPIF